MDFVCCYFHTTLDDPSRVHSSVIIKYCTCRPTAKVGVKKRNISGSTRSDLGRLCRDTFASLKKTCRKLGVGFRDYPSDRLSGDSLIPWLPDLMKQRVLESPG